ncbi:MAG: NYN domain-containing protein [Thermomicrobiales bacterium]
MSTPQDPTPRPRANMYVDGFNLYHGCFDDSQNRVGRAHWRDYRWLDLDELCAKLFPGYLINHIHYFTALVDPRPDNPDNRARQQVYIRALETISHLTVHYGRFATNAKYRPLADPQVKRPIPLDPLEMAYVIERKEKGSDVNLASHLLLDGFKRSYDVALVITNDSDLAEPIRIVRGELGLQVVVVNPRKNLAFDLKGIANSYKEIRQGVLRDSQFPETLTDKNGIITKPPTW